MSLPARAAITLDVDGVRHYHAIHGLGPPPDQDPPLSSGVRRFLELCARYGIRGTLFVVGRDLEDEAFADVVREAVRAGHEIASHSHGHDYDLSRRAPAEIQADVWRSVETIAGISGTRPRGFRAPGYNLSEPLLDALERNGLEYDSSVLPSPTYFVARALAIGVHALRGRRSSSLIGDPRAFATPTMPYRPRRGTAWRPARSRVEGRALVEIPITTLPLGVPWIGTTLSMSPLPVAAGETALALRRDPIVLELHAIDLCDVEDGFAPALAEVQRDLRVPLEKKLARLEAVFRMLAQASETMPLGEISRGFSSPAPGRGDASERS